MLTGVILLSHWIACAWGLEANLHTSRVDTWLGSAYCVPVPALALANASSPGDSAVAAAAGGASAAGGGMELAIGGSDAADLLGGEAAAASVSVQEECLAPGRLYVAALYFSTYTIFGVGYGDVTPVAANTAEQAVAVVLMVLGSVAW